MGGVSTLSADQTHAIFDLFRADAESLERSFPGEQGARQPVHTVYGGAHLFKRDIASKFGRLALASLAEYAPDAESLRQAMGLAGDLAHAQRVRDRVARKLADQAVEDFRIDFEDGYGHRPEAEEDAHAEASARELASGAREGVLPAFIGLRIKALSREAGARALRTLDRFITTLANELGGSLPPGFVVTLPKVQSASQVAALRVALELLEGALGIEPGAIGVELMVEQTQALFGPDGRLALPGLKDAAQGRLRAAHLGAYDFASALGIAASEQDLLHPACDFARLVMQVSLAGSGVFLVDGATNVLPVGPHRAPVGDTQRSDNRAAVHAAWQKHFNHVRRAMRMGFYQGWDLHPAQLVARYAAVISMFDEGREAATARLANFVEQAARATMVGSVFDDAATGQGLLNFFLRGRACGALTDADVAATGLREGELEARSFAAIVRARRL